QSRGAPARRRGLRGACAAAGYESMLPWHDTTAAFRLPRRELRDFHGFRGNWLPEMTQEDNGADSYVTSSRSRGPNLPLLGNPMSCGQDRDLAPRARHGAPGLRPSTHAVRREGMARDVLHNRDGALADERDRDRMGAHAVARDAARGVGRAQASRWLSRSPRRNPRP